MYIGWNQRLATGRAAAEAVSATKEVLQVGVSE